MEIKLSELKELFLDYIFVEKGRAKATEKNYRSYLENFEKFAGDIFVSQIDYNLIRNYRMKMREENNGTILTKLKALRGMLRYANTHDIPAFQAEKIELPKRVKPIVSYLTNEEVVKILDQPFKKNRGNDNRAIRDRAVMELLFSSGLRVSELVNLNRDEVINNSRITIRGKGGKVRMVFISDRAKYFIEKYLKNRRDVSPALFTRYCTTYNASYTRKRRNVDETARLTSRHIERLVKDYAREAGIYKKVSPHTFRHSFAVNLLENGANIFHLKELLGHSSIETTTIYLHASNKKLEEVYNQFHKL